MNNCTIQVSSWRRNKTVPEFYPASGEMRACVQLDVLVLNLTWNIQSDADVQIRSTFRASISSRKAARATRYNIASQSFWSDSYKILNVNCSFVAWIAKRLFTFFVEIKDFSNTFFN